MQAFSIIFGIFGGMAVFLYGLFILSGGFKKIFSQRLKKFLEKLTGNSFKAVGLGAFITSVIQSSSLTMVTLIGLLNAGLLGLHQAIGVMLGAEIGTTITAQLIVFKIGLFYAPILFIGMILLFFFKKKTIQQAGQIIFGFGLIFLGMQMMSNYARPIKEIPEAINLLAQFGKNPFLGIIIGSLFTALIQSSSATIGLVVAMSAEGLIGLVSAIALILGANIGTCITGAFASIKSCSASKRLSFTQLMINISGVIIFGALILPYSRIIALTSDNLSRQIANAHTIFNIIVTLASIPLIGLLVRFSEKIFRVNPAESEKGIKFLDDNILNIPGAAILQAKKEILRMAKIAAEMIKTARDVLSGGKKELIGIIREKEEAVDELHHFIDKYLTKISETDLSELESQQLTLLLHTVTDIERVADHADNLSEIAEFISKNQIVFSETAKKELNLICSESIDSFLFSIKALEENDKKSALKTIEKEKKVNELDESLRVSHFERLKNGFCTSQSGPIYLEIIDNIERISDHAENIAGSIITGF